VKFLAQLRPPILSSAAASSLPEVAELAPPECVENNSISSSQEPSSNEKTQ